MPKFSVRFHTRRFSKVIQVDISGVIEIEAESAERAHEIAEQENEFDLYELMGNCDSAGLEVESVEELKEPANESNTD